MQQNKQHAIDWLRRRGIQNETLNMFSIKWGEHPFAGDCIVIPVHDTNGEFLFNKYRRDPLSDQKPKYLYDKGAKMALYGANHLKDDLPYVVVTEGELDALVLWSMNIPAVSSTGGSMSFKQEWIDFILSKTTQIYVAFDNDDAGAQGAARLWEMNKDIKYIFIPEQANVKDISDFIERGGDFYGLLEGAKAYTDKVSILEDLRYRTSHWLPTRFHKAWISSYGTEKREETAAPEYPQNSDELERAKAVPMTSIRSLEFKGFNGQGKALCPFHQEETASFHYFKKTNTAYCFGCGHISDSIDLYQRVHKCSFKEALKKLAS